MAQRFKTREKVRRGQKRREKAATFTVTAICWADFEK